MLLRTLFISILVHLSFLSYAQVPSFKFQHLQEGLSSQYVNGILQDSKGFLWIGTRDGLNRYDGYSIKSYKPVYGDSTSLLSAIIIYLYQDSEQNLWIGTEGGGLSRYNYAQDNFTNILFSQKDKRITEDNVCYILEDKFRNLWICLYNHGVVQLNLKDSTTRFYQETSGEIPSNNAYQMLEDKDERFLLLTGNGISSYNYENQTFSSVYTDVPNKPKSKCLLEDNADNLWMGLEKNGLLRYNKSTRSYKIYGHDPKNPFGVSGYQIQTLYQDSNNNIWIATQNGGVQLYNPQKDNFYTFVHDSKDEYSIGSNSITRIYEDKSNNVWFGTHGAGLNYVNIKQHSITRYKHNINNSESLSHNIVTSFYEAPDGRIWIGTDGGGLNMFDPRLRSFQCFTTQHGLPSNVITDIEKEDEEHIWLATWEKGICLFNINTFKTIPLSGKSYHYANLSLPDIKSIKKDSGGKLWIATHGGGFNILDTKTNLLYRDKNNPFGFDLNLPKYAVDILEDEKGNMWAATYDGFFRFNNNKIFTYQPSAKTKGTIISKYISTVFEDHKGQIWVGTNRGLDLYLPTEDKFRHISEELPLPKTIKGIMEDSNQNLWISSNEGLTKFNPETGQIKNFNVPDGLQANEFFERACLKASTGEFYYGGVNGFNVFHPDSLRDNQYKPPVAIIDFQIFNKSQYPGDPQSPLQVQMWETKEIRLNYDQSVISFGFVALNFISPEKNQYAYMLEGFDPDWQYIGSERKTTYTNLDPGTYTFKVKAANNDGVWNENYAEVTLEIIPPFYKTWWFIASCVIILAVLIYGVVISRIKYLKTQRRVLKKMVNEQTAEINLQKEELELKNKELYYQTEEIMMQRDNMKSLANKLEEANIKKTRFFTNVSHEFRTSLTLVISPVKDVLSNERITPSVKDKMQVASKNADRLLRLVNQLLDIRRIENEIAPLTLVQENISEFIREIQSSFTPVAAQSNISFSYSSNTEIIGWYDPDKIDKITYNLLSNAFKFTPKHGSIKIILNKIPVTSLDRSFKIFNQSHINPTGDYLEIVVEDTGIGIPPEKINHIFDRYYHIETESSVEGAGIGLALVKDLVNLNYGEITVESHVNKGSVFKIYLPISHKFYLENKLIESFLDSAPSENEVEFKIKENTGLKEIAEKVEFREGISTVLIVEDNPELRKYVKMSLEDNYDIIEAGNGKEGLELVLRHMPALIISDVMMPEMDGIEFCSRIKSNIRTSHLPVILLTAKSLPEHQIEGLEHGADDYIVKPFQSQILALRVRNIIESRQKLREKFAGEAFIQPEEIATNPTDEKFLKEFRTIVENHIADAEFDISKLVKEIGISRSILYEKVKQLTNMTINDFIQTLRLKKAARLLRESELRISEISYETGFSDPRYFSKCFRKQFGVTPKEFKEQKISIPKL